MVPSEDLRFTSKTKGIKWLRGLLKEHGFDKDALIRLYTFGRLGFNEVTGVIGQHTIIQRQR